MINQKLVVDHWRSSLERDARIQVDDFLQPAIAELLHDCLRDQVPWSLQVEGTSDRTVIEHEPYARMSDEQRLALYLDVAASAREAAADDDGFRFAYDSYMMVEAYKDGLDPHLPLHRVLEFLNSPPYIGFLHALTGDTRIRRVSAQATRYRIGQFLRRHSDINSKEGRLFAYVINLSRDWQADWGGLLQFIGADGRVTDTFLPRWNTLSLFKVPADHVVTMVMPWASRDRYAITGWLLL